MDIEVERLQHLIDNAKRIVFFGGAGVSTESGIKDFRSKDGLYKLQSKYGRPYEEMLSHTYFMQHTDTFYQFYREFMINTDAKPNAAHKYFKDLESSHKVTIITQNIDGLHTEAGSKDVVEFHGSVKRNTCLECGKHFGLDYVMSQDGVPHCDKCGGIIKPDVVLFEEGIDEYAINHSLDSLSKADLLIVVGSSLNVYPAAGLVQYFRGNRSILINRDVTPLDYLFKIVIHDDIINVIKELEK